MADAAPEGVEGVAPEAVAADARAPGGKWGSGFMEGFMKGVRSVTAVGSIAVSQALQSGYALCCNFGYSVCRESSS